MKELLQWIKEKDIRSILECLFEKGTDNQPRVRQGFRRETDHWDFKGGLPGLREEKKRAWADIAADVLAFHNKSGGILIFGIDDKTYGFVGTRDAIDAKRFNDQVRKYVGDRFWIEFAREFPQGDGRYLGIAVIPGHELAVLPAQADAPFMSGQRKLFYAGDLCIREGDQTRIIGGSEADAYLRAHRLPGGSSRYLIDDERSRILRPDWDRFVVREQYCQAVHEALRDDRTYVTSLTGIGGIGKTALAIWGTLESYKERAFEYIVSTTAKDRELGPQGIRPTSATMSSYSDLLDALLQVLGFSEESTCSIEDKEKNVQDLLTGTSVLLLVDNLETVEDDRVVAFLQSLPKPAKAIATSRKARLRKGCYPVDVGPMTEKEALEFLDLHARRRGKTDMLAASKSEREKVIEGCSRVPLVIEWLVANSKTVREALAFSGDLSGRGNAQEVLEFCFRRVHQSLSGGARDVLACLSLYPSPQVQEAVAAGVAMPLDQISDGIDELEECSLLERVWDSKRHDHAFRLLPITRKFTYQELRKRPGEEQKMLSHLASWYEGRDVTEEQRPYIVAVRQGERDPDVHLVDAAIQLRREGKARRAEELFQKAIDRAPESWKARKEYAELLRDKGDLSAALEQWEHAVRQVPRKGRDRAIVCREYANTLRKAGSRDNLSTAVDCYEAALRETPNDVLSIHGLAVAHVRLGHNMKAVPLLEELTSDRDPETRKRSYELLIECYSKLGDPIKRTETEKRQANDIQAHGVEVRSKRTVEASSNPTIRRRGKQRRGRKL